MLIATFCFFLQFLCPLAYFIDGNVIDLNGKEKIQLRLYPTLEELNIQGSSHFGFQTDIPAYSLFEVKIVTQPVFQNCRLNSIGYYMTSNITHLTVNCGIATTAPSWCPTNLPSLAPSQLPTISPILSPTMKPSALPSCSPSHFPSLGPSAQPSSSPSKFPSLSPTISPSTGPSIFIETTPVLETTAMEMGELNATTTEISQITTTQAEVFAPTQAPTINFEIDEGSPVAYSEMIFSGMDSSTFQKFQPEIKGKLSSRLNKDPAAVRLMESNYRRHRRQLTETVDVIVAVEVESHQEVSDLETSILSDDFQNNFVNDVHSIDDSLASVGVEIYSYTPETNAERVDRDGEIVPEAKQSKQTHDISTIGITLLVLAACILILSCCFFKFLDPCQKQKYENERLEDYTTL